MPSAPVNFNDLWSSKNTAELYRIGKNRRGVCGCRQFCKGIDRLTSGSTFREHMSRIHGTQATVLKRPPRHGLPESSRAAAASALLHYSGHRPAYTDTSTEAFMAEETQLGQSSRDLQIVSGDVYGFLTDGIAFTSDVEMSEEEEGGTWQGDDRGISDQAIQQAENPLEDGQRLPAIQWLSVHQAPEDDDEHDADLDNLEEVSVPPATLQPVDDLCRVVEGTDLLGDVAQGDLITQWPDPIPAYLLFPAYDGRHTNPYLIARPLAPDHVDHKSLLYHILPLLALTHSATFNVPRRAVEVGLKTGVSTVRLAVRQQFARLLTTLEQHPDVTPALLQCFRALDPAPSLPIAPKTLSAALNRLQLDDDVIVNPQCCNEDCFHVFYDYLIPENTKDLPIRCPQCQISLQDASGRPTFLRFGRRTIQSELETVMTVPGVEDALEMRAVRKQTRDREDADLISMAQPSIIGKVYREQDDGSAWTLSPSGPTHLTDALSLTVNLAVDWANASSNRSAATHSMGPITLLIADLPSHMRSSLACTMLVGITPGPKPPRSKNLYKLLLPLALEIRAGHEHGLWIRTPKYPFGRMIRVSLGCLSADRPAAIEVTGGPFYKALDSPCLRCTVSYDDISKHIPAPHRDAAWHNQAVLQQIIDIPEAVKADKEIFKNEDRTRRQGTRRKPAKYTNKREKEVSEAATITRGNISSLMLLPGFDQFRAATFDPMHSLLEGLLKTYFFRVLALGQKGMAEGQDGAEGSDAGIESDTISLRTAERLGREAEEELKLAQRGEVRPHDATTINGLRQIATQLKDNPRAVRRRVLGPKEMARQRELLLMVSAPTSVGRLHREWGGAAAGTPTADDWRSFALVYGPLVLPRLWLECGPQSARRPNHRMIRDELTAMMMLFEIISLSFRSSISDTQLQRLDTLIPEWQRLALRLHPSLVNNSNIHVISHLTEDIRRYGPIYGWWAFPVERVNYVIKNCNVSGGSASPEVVAFHAFLKKRQLDGAAARVFALGRLDDDAEREAVDDTRHALEMVSTNTAATVLAELATRYGESDGSNLTDITPHRAGNVVTRWRGGGKAIRMDATLHQSLRACLRRLRMDTRVDRFSPRAEDAKLSYCPTKAFLRKGIEWGGVRIDAAEWSFEHTSVPDEASSSALIRSRNSIIEIRSPANRHACNDSSTVFSGVLTKLFEHQLLMPDGTEGPARLFGVLRRFVPYAGPDAYNYGAQWVLVRVQLVGLIIDPSHSPNLDVRLWKAYAFESPMVVHLGPQSLSHCTALAITCAPTNPLNPMDGDDIWITRPLYHVGLACC